MKKLVVFITTFMFLFVCQVHAGEEAVIVSSEGFTFIAEDGNKLDDTQKEALVSAGRYYSALFGRSILNGRILVKSTDTFGASECSGY